MTIYCFYRVTTETNGADKGSSSYEGGFLSTEEMSPSAATIRAWTLRFTVQFLLCFLSDYYCWLSISNHSHLLAFFKCFIQIVDMYFFNQSLNRIDVLIFEIENGAGNGNMKLYLALMIQKHLKILNLAA